MTTKHRRPTSQPDFHVQTYRYLSRCNRLERWREARQVLEALVERFGSRAGIAARLGEDEASKVAWARSIERWSAGETVPNRDKLDALQAMLQGDPIEARQARIELYAARVAQGLEPCTGRVPPPAKPMPYLMQFLPPSRSSRRSA